MRLFSWGLNQCWKAREWAAWMLTMGKPARLAAMAPRPKSRMTSRMRSSVMAFTGKPSALRSMSQGPSRGLPEARKMPMLGLLGPEPEKHSSMVGTAPWRFTMSAMRA